MAIQHLYIRGGIYRVGLSARHPSGAECSTSCSIRIHPGLVTKTSYDYDEQGRPATITYPSGRRVTYTYDTLDRVIRVSQDGRTLVRDIAYDAMGNRKWLVAGSGTVDQWLYDASGTRVRQWSLGQAGSGPAELLGPWENLYKYDGADRLIEAGEWALAYDANSRLRQASGFGLTDTLIHDVFNNNTSSVSTSQSHVPSTFNNFTFNPMQDNHLPGLATNGGLTQVSENNFGEITCLGTGMSSSEALTITWDGLGRVASIAGAGERATHRYAASGLRTVRISDLDTSQNRLYAYTASGHLLSEFTFDPTPSWKRDVVYLGELAVAEIDANGTHELHFDHQGTPRVITNLSGDYEGNQAFGPYGEKIDRAQLWDPHTRERYEVTFDGYIPLTGYTGHLQTEPTGLIYMRGRFYSPAWHRFMNSDQGVDPNSINQFAYVCGNPMMMTDPTGLYGKDVHELLNRVLAEAVGFNHEMAGAIGRQAQLVDEDGRGPFKGVQQRGDWHFPSQERVNAAWEGFKNSKNLNDLGASLHVFQDSFSHAGYGPRLGHAYAGTTPDQTYRRVDLAMNMAEQTYNRLVEAIGRLGYSKQGAVAFEDLKSKLKEYFGAQDETKKQEMLNDIEHEIKDLRKAEKSDGPAEETKDPVKDRAITR